MGDPFVERRAAVIDFHSKVTLNMVIEIVAIAIMFTGWWVTMRYEITELKNDIGEVQSTLDELNRTRWRPLDDYLFMEMYSKMNNLKMSEHTGGTPDAQRR